jgi:hypothetical protein
MTILTVHDNGREVTVKVDNGIATELKTQEEINQAYTEIAKANEKAKQEKKELEWWAYEGYNTDPTKVDWGERL